MTESAKRAICIGEAIVELARGGDGRFALASAGDTFNTAIYLARAGVPVAFATALGDDAFSEAIVALAKAETIDTDLILARPAGFRAWRWRTPTAKASAARIFGAPLPPPMNCSNCRSGAGLQKACRRPG
jgi:hypothetical protein